MDLRQRLAPFPGGFAARLSWQYGATLVTVVSGFAYSITVARYLGVSVYGLMALAAAAATFVAPFFQANMRDYLIRYMTQASERGGRSEWAGDLSIAVGANIVSLLAYLALMMVLAGIAAPIWSDSGLLPNAMRLAAVGVGAQLFLPDAAIGILRAGNRVSTIALIQAGIGIARFLLTWTALWAFDARLLAVLAISAACYAFGGIAFIAMALRSLGTWPALRAFGPAWPPSFTSDQRMFLWRNYLTNIFAIPAKDLDINILGLFAPVESVGVYRMAKNFIAIVWTLTDPVHLVLYPEYARLWHRGDKPAIRRITTTLSALLAATAVMIFAATALVVPFLIVAISGQGFAASGALYISMIGSILVWLPMMWLTPLALATGRNDITLRVTYVSAALSVITYAVASSLAGASGTAIAYSMNIVGFVILQFVWTYRANLVPYFWTAEAPGPAWTERNQADTTHGKSPGIARFAHETYDRETGSGVQVE